MLSKLKSNYLLLVILVGLCITLQSQAVNINFGPNGCTLQDAIRSANTDSSVGNCSSGLGHDFLISPDVWIISLNSVLPTITSDITIKTATSSGLLEINGDGHRIFKITGNSTNVILENVYLHHGGATSAIDAGGAIRIIDATVDFHDSFLYDNSSYVGKGGAIYIDNGEVNIDNTVLFGNGAYNTGDFQHTYGGAIYADDSILNVIRSNFLENRSKFGFDNSTLDFVYTGRAASIYIEGGELNIDSSLFSENYSGIHAEGIVANITNTTFSRRIVHPYPDHSLIDFREFSSVTLNHNTFNTPASISDSILNMTNTILRGECRFFNNSWIIDSGNLHNTNISVCVGNLFDYPRLLELEDNGGPTSTYALHHLSDAIDAGDPTYCLATDQRGEARGALCDIGAFEVVDSADIEVSGSFMQSAPYVSNQDIVYNFKIKNNGPALATAVEVDIDTTSVFITEIDSTLCSSFPCIIPSIQSGQEITIPVMMAVGNYLNSPFDMMVSASSTANSLYTDFDLNNNTASVNHPINQGADMGVSMNLISEGPYFIGQNVVYEATITNNGQQTASNVELEFVPTGLNNMLFENCSSSVGQVCSYPNLLNNASGVITIKAEVIATLFDASAEVSSGLTDVNDSNNIDNTLNNGAVTEADISIDASIEQSGPYYAYQYLEFNLKITNGNNPASNVQVYSDFPGAEFIGINGCSVPCIIPTMAANTVQSFTLQYFAPTELDAMNNTFTNHILVTPAQSDPNLLNNAITIQEPIVAAADVGANLSLITMGPYLEGQSIQYDLRVANNGVSHATNVDIALSPDNLTLLWAASDNCETVDCNLPNLDRFLTENITLVYEIDDQGDFDLSVNVLANELDIFPNNNSDVTGNGGTATLNENDVIFENGFED